MGQIIVLFGVATPEIAGHAHFRTLPQICQRAPVTEGQPLPAFGGAGTGGIESAEFVASRQGYRLFTLITDDPDVPDLPYSPFAALMVEIQTGFGRTLSHLPAVFGVSRQTLYNWMKGELPKDQHREKLVQLAEAARVFTPSGFKPTAAMLDRTVAKGKSFIELLGDGASGREMAQKLIRIVQRGASERNKLDAMLGDRKAPRLEVSHLGRQSFQDEM